MRDGVIPRRSPLTNISAPEGSDSTRSSASGTAWRRAASHPDRNWGGNSAGSGVNSGRSARTRERSASASDVFPSHRRRIPLRRKISARNGRGSFSGMTAGIGSRSRRAERSSRSGAANFSRSAGSRVDATSSAEAGGAGRQRSDPQRRSATALRRLDVDLISDVPVYGDRRLADLEDEGRVTLQEAKTAARNDPEGRELLQAPLRARGDEHDPHNGPEGGLGQAHDQGTDLRADPVAALPSRDRTAVRTGRGVAQEGADALDDGLRQDVLELAGAVFQLHVVQLEQGLQQHLGKTVTADDSSGPSLPVLREEDLLPRGGGHAP